MKIKNSFWFRHFLICNKFAKEICGNFGWYTPNFAHLILEENDGRLFNSQMTKHFWSIDDLLCEISESDPGLIFENLNEEENISINELSQLTEEDLTGYYSEYVIGKLNFNV